MSDQDSRPEAPSDREPLGDPDSQHRGTDQDPSSFDEFVDDMKGQFEGARERLAESSSALMSWFDSTRDKFERELEERKVKAAEEIAARAREVAEAEATADSGDSGDTATSTAPPATTSEELRRAVETLDGADSQAELLSRLLEKSCGFASRAALLLGSGGEGEEKRLKVWNAIGFDPAANGSDDDDAGLEGLEGHADISGRTVDCPAEWHSVLSAQETVLINGDGAASFSDSVHCDAPRRSLAIPFILRDAAYAVLYADDLGSDQDGRFDVDALQLLSFVASQSMECLTLRSVRPAASLLDATSIGTEQSSDDETDADDTADEPVDDPVTDELDSSKSADETSEKPGRVYAESLAKPVQYRSSGQPLSATDSGDDAAATADGDTDTDDSGEVGGPSDPLFGDTSRTKADDLDESSEGTLPWQTESAAEPDLDATQVLDEGSASSSFADATPGSLEADDLADAPAIAPAAPQPPPPPEADPSWALDAESVEALPSTPDEQDSDEQDSDEDAADAFDTPSGHDLETPPAWASGADQRQSFVSVVEESGGHTPPPPPASPLATQTVDSTIPLPPPAAPADDSDEDEPEAETTDAEDSDSPDPQPSPEASSHELPPTPTFEAPTSPVSEPEEPSPTAPPTPPGGFGLDGPSAPSTQPPRPNVFDSLSPSAESSAPTSEAASGQPSAFTAEPASVESDLEDTGKTESDAQDAEPPESGDDRSAPSSPEAETSNEQDSAQEASPQEASSNSDSAPAAKASPSQVQPPQGLEGPGMAFTRKPSEGEDPRHDEARRLARLLVSELKLYNEDEITRGRRLGNIYQSLREDIDRSRRIYDERVDSEVRQSGDFLHEELVKGLADGDASLLGM